MHSKILASLLFLSVTAWADDRDALDQARQREHDASVRVWYHDAETTIAERDLATAHIIADTTSKQWNNAVREHRNDDASTWALRHAEAKRDERDAQSRVTHFRWERDVARNDLQASTDEVHRLERVARRQR